MAIQRKSEAREFASNLRVAEPGEPSHSDANDDRVLQSVSHRCQLCNSLFVL